MCLQEVEKLGGIRAIAISHPHFFAAMSAWSLCFNAPVYVHEASVNIRKKTTPSCWHGCLTFKRET